MNSFTKHLSLRLTPCLLAMACTSSLAQGAERVLVPPTPVEVTGLDAVGAGTEGLHRVRLTVKADGSAADVEVLGGFTNPQASNFLVQMVKGWTFEPGSVNGEPADFFNQEYVIRNYLAEELLLSEEANEKLAEIGTLVTEGDHDKALRETRRLIDRDAVTVLDYTIAHEILTDIYMAMDMPFEALEASQIATMSRINLLGEKEYLLPEQILEQALRKRLLLALTVQQLAEAARVATILDQDLAIGADDPVREVALELDTALASADPLVSQAKIVDKSWSYQPARRIFTVADLDGRLQEILVRCQRGNIELDYEEGVDWTLPDSLGECSLNFNGRKGTRFTVYEFAE